MSNSGHHPRMLMWLKHQYAVYAYGAGVLMLVGVFAGASAVLGAVVLYPISALVGYEPGNLDWLLASIACAPFGLPTWAKLIADLVRDNPPPTDSDLRRARSGLPPRK